MIQSFTHGITFKLIYAWYSWYTIAGVEKDFWDLAEVWFTHVSQNLRTIKLFTHDTFIYACHHMQTDTQLFTHDTRDLRNEELDLRMIHKITSFTHANWFTHSTHDTHKFSFTHDTHDLRKIYAKGNPFTHDTCALIVFTHHTQTGNYLRMVLRIYALFTHDTWTA